MADQPKKKPANARTVNDTRPSGKRPKSRPSDNFGHGGAYRGSHTRRTPQTYLQKVLLGQGALRNINRPIAGSTEGRWKAPQSVGIPYDAAQVAVNKRLYPHLFTER